MTDKTIDWTSGKPEKMSGWFSWRHKTRNAHEDATARYLANHGPEARRRTASEQPQREVKTFLCGHRSSSETHPCDVKR